MSRDDGPQDTQQSHGQDDAARKLQKLWRGRNDAKDQFLTSQARWDEVVGDTALKAAGDGAGRGDNSQRARWGRAGKYVMRLQDPDAMMAGAGTDVPDAARKNLETQHWLELIDGKHRYGSNLKYYFAKWKEADTEDNFFNWLDNGGGKDLDLKECSREQLEKERIYYLTNEQRLNYLVQIDDQGRLRWAKNNEPVDTSPGRWKDAGDGKGIVPLDSEDHPELEEDDQSGGLDSPGSLAVNHYVEPPQGNSKLTTSVKRNLTLKGLVNKLLRKTLQKNTWIYVSDKNYNIFVGIKKPGTFQHSSFLAGGKVTSAGLISVKDGVIHTLSPLSGHYRTSIDHFHQFLDVLDKKGVDISHVKKTKAEVALWTLEHVAKAKKKKGALVTSTKEKARDLVRRNSGGTDEEDKSDEDTGWKREILYGRKKEEEDEGSAEHTPEGQEAQRAVSDTATTKQHTNDERPASAPARHKDTSHPRADFTVEKASPTEETPPAVSDTTSPDNGPSSDNTGEESSSSPRVDGNVPSSQTDPHHH
ncbi:unnamed protein product [Peniophora sp. CBMAI 1063]|nr:unnamed protein product [Peniophora sp. CBMAI 1063]